MTEEGGIYTSVTFLNGTYSFMVTATDSGIPPRNTSVTVYLNVDLPRTPVGTDLSQSAVWIYDRWNSFTNIIRRYIFVNEFHLSSMFHIYTLNNFVFVCFYFILFYFILFYVCLFVCFCFLFFSFFVV